MIPIIDAHHHIWRQDDLAWLKGPMQPRIFGPYEPIRRDYPIAEYLADLTGTGVVGSVYCQTNWPPKGELTEVEWVACSCTGTRTRSTASRRGPIS
jgi:predicted TIM-barrel fold metal-dependent hydrolase